MSTLIKPPRWDMMFNFDYAFSIAYDLIKNIPDKVVGHYRVTAFKLDQEGKVVNVIHIKGENLTLYIQYEFINNEIFTLVNPPAVGFLKWIENTYLRLLNADNVLTVKDLGKIASIYYQILNAYEMAVENGQLHWSYISALTH